jgi:hypothetical protein
MGGFTHNEPLPLASFLKCQAGPEWPAIDAISHFYELF